VRNKLIHMIKKTYQFKTQCKDDVINLRVTLDGAMHVASLQADSS